MTAEYISHSAGETEAIGEQLAKELGGVSVLLLFGDLGAGKTTLTRGIARAFACEEEAKSPTYAIVNEYLGPKKVCHFDLYRLNGEEDLYDIGFEDYISRGALCIVEWPEKAMAAMPKNASKIEIIKQGDQKRLIKVEIC